MKIRPLFAKYEKQLVQFANTPLGHLYLGTRNLPVIRVTPDSIFYLRNIDNGIATIEADHWSGSRLLKKFRKLFNTVGFIAAMGAKFALDVEAVMYPLMIGIASPADFSPDADPETTSVDGYVDYNLGLGNGVSWATIRGQATGTAANSDGNEVFSDVHFDQLGGTDWYHFRRGFLLFDTSAIGAGATVTAAVIKVRSDGIIEDLPDSAVIVACTPASNTNIITADFNQLGTTALSNTIANDGSFSENPSVDNTFTLNATGRAAVDVSGISKFGWRNESDRANSEPATGGLATNDGARFDIKSRDNGSNFPVLTVTFTEPVSANANMFLVM